MAAKRKGWIEHKELKPFCAAFVFMDEATRTRGNAMLTANTPKLASKISRRGGPELVFAHALVGPSDLLACVKSESPDKLVDALQTKIRNSGDEEENFLHRVQFHLVVWSQGRIDLSRTAFSHHKQNKRRLRAWILGTVADPDPKKGARLAKSLSRNPDVKLVASVLGRYDYFIFAETTNMARMQQIVDQHVRNKQFIATDTRIIMQE
jgi:Lrp/AsnC ligand binding domain